MLRSSASPIAADPREPAGAAVAGATSAPRPIKLLLITDTAIAYAGGSERYLRNLVALLPPERYRITLVQLVPDSHADDKLHSDLTSRHATLLHLPVRAIYGRGGWRALRELSRLHRRERFDIVQSHHEKSDLINAMLPRLPGCLHISNRRDMGFKKSAKLKRLFRLLNHRYDQVIAPAQPILDELVRSEGVAAERMLWIPNGVDTRRFRPYHDWERNAARHGLGLDERTLAFACTARLTAEKRHIDLIDAFAAVRAGVPQTHLFLIGDGPLRGEIDSRIAALGLTDAVTVLGMRNDVETLLPAMDIGLLVSATEGMSNAILEMMACGLPMIATAVGGNPSLVRADVTGLLVPPRQPEKLADRMTVLACSPDARRRMGAAARRCIERRYSLAAMARAFDLAYRQLLRTP